MQQTGSNPGFFRVFRVFRGHPSLRFFVLFAVPPRCVLCGFPPLPPSLRFFVLFAVPLRCGLLAFQSKYEESGQAAYKPAPKL